MLKEITVCEPVAALPYTKFQLINVEEMIKIEKITIWQITQ